ncbi:helix-turn-helix domain-containing protein, partial [Fusobacterium necrophorum]
IKNGIIKGSGNFSNLLESVKREDYDFSKEERIEIIHFLLLLLSYGCKADAICYLLNISRSTLKSDMKFVRKKLAEKNLQICSRTKRGLIIQGREILIRKLLWEEYKKILRIEGKNVLFLEEA